MATASAVRDEAAPHRFAKDRLKAFVERVERLEEEKKALADDIRDVFSEAKANGFDVKALRAVVRLRKQDIDERREQEAILETYLQALGMLDYEAATATAARARDPARTQACDFASDAVIRTTIPKPAKGNDPGQSVTKISPQPGEPVAGVIKSGSASAPRSPYSLAPAAPDADKGARGDDRAPCPATNSNAEPVSNASSRISPKLPAIAGVAQSQGGPSIDTDPQSPPVGGERPRPAIPTSEIPPGGADDFPETPRDLVIGDPANNWLRPQPTAPPSTGPP